MAIDDVHVPSDVVPATPAGWTARLVREVVYAAVAIQFLTRLAVPPLAGFEPSWMHRSLAYFPLAGAIVGAISGAVLMAASAVWDAPIAALLAIAAGCAATGCFHEDGLADAADGLGGGQTRERRLEIMRDSRIGTYGAVTLGLVLALKVAALSSLAPFDAALALVAVHAAARIAPVVASRVVPYGGDLVGAKVPPLTPTNRRMAVAIAIGLLPCLVLLPPQAAFLGLMAGSLAAAWLLASAKALIGGQTGDILGASEQMFETAMLLALAGSAA